MTIEEIVAKHFKRTTPLYKLSWFTVPESTKSHLYAIQEEDIWKAVDDSIKEASEEECLTSPLEYIRECKKWLQTHDLEYEINIAINISSGGKK